MRRTKYLTGLVLATALLAGAPAFAEDGPGAAYTRNLEVVGGRVVQLVEAIPEDKMGWRPMEGVRSVSEAAMHMASANYFFAGQMGLAVPEGVDPRSMEQITDKAEVIATLKASMVHLDKAFKGVEDVSKEMDIFGNPGTLEDMMLIAIGHGHEHFGQLIAYARSNEITPPWSQ